MKRLWLLVCVVALCASGCTGVSISRGGTRGLLPEIPTPKRPVLQELTPEEAAEAGKLSAGVKAKIQANQLEIMKYCKKFEVSVQEYNTYVKVNNAMARAEMGLSPKATESSDAEDKPVTGGAQP